MMDYEEPRLIVAKRLTEDRKGLSQHPTRKRRRSFLFQESPGPKKNQEKPGLPEPTDSRRQHTEKNNCSSPTPYVSLTKKFTLEHLQRLLFDQNDIQEINVKRPVESQQNECFWCDATSTTPGFQCPLHKHNKPAVKESLHLPLALRSLPPEVGLCTSTIPGQGYGICAKRKIPAGAWIGPYEGKFVKPEDLSSTTDTTYMWEIFKNGTLTGYIDGSDVNLTSWMRFIRCARHKQEQNLFAFQYLGRIFYRAFKNILPGEEMLVWYDEKYPQYLGIPWMIFDLAAAALPGTSPRADKIIVVPSPEKDNRPRKTSTQESIFPSPPPSPLSKPTNPWARTSTSIEEKRSPRHPSQEDRTSYNKTVPSLEHTPVKHVQRNGTPPTYRAKCKYSVCKKRTIISNRFCRGQNLKSPDKTFCTQVQQTLHHCSQGAVSFRVANQLCTHAIIPGRKACSYCSHTFNRTPTLNN